MKANRKQATARKPEPTAAALLAKIEALGRKLQKVERGHGQHDSIGGPTRTRPDDRPRFLKGKETTKMTNYYTLHFSGRVGRYTEEVTAIAAVAASKGIAFANQADFMAAISSTRSEFQAMIYNSMLMTAQSAGLAAPTRLAKPVKRFESREIALDRIYRLAVALGDQCVPVTTRDLPAPNMAEATPDEIPAEPPTDAPTVDAATTPAEAAPERAEALVLASPWSPAINRTSELPGPALATEGPVGENQDLARDQGSAQTLPGLASDAADALTISVDRKTLSGSDDRGEKARPHDDGLDSIGEATPSHEGSNSEVVPIFPTIGWNGSMTLGSDAATTAAAASENAALPSKVRSIVRKQRAKKPEGVTGTRNPTATPEQVGATLARASKLAMVVGMLMAEGGTTIAAVMEATGWQPHTCRGFFAGTCRKRLGLNVESSEKDDTGRRVYRIVE